ncbi:MAG TPA: FUSC family protein [Myxococcaceae bacterium]|nr:FUSC family protein [Myxococcaceae bacterium]
MTGATSPDPGPLGLLLRELGPSPERWRASLRLALVATLATGGVMALHVPNGDYLVVILFLVAGGDTWVSPWRAGWRLLGVVAGSLLVLVSLGAFADKPWVLFPLQGVVLGLVVFASRTTRIPFAVSLIAVCFLLAVPEYVDAPERVLETAVQRLAMIALGVAVGTLIPAVVWRRDPEDLLLADLARPLRLVEDVLDRALGGTRPSALRQRRLVATAGIAHQLQLLENVESDSPGLRRRHTEQLKVITECQVALRGALDLEKVLARREVAAAVGPALVQRLHAARGRAASVRQALVERRAIEPTASPASAAHGDGSSIELHAALDQLEQGLGGIEEMLGFLSRPASGAASSLPLPGAEPRRSVIGPGFSPSNTEEVHVALKAALTATVCGLLYNAAHWPGIGACVFAVLLLAQGTVGASLQRAVVQVAGVLLGAGWALLVVLVMPNMTSVASLMVLVFPLFLGVAWLCYGGGITSGASLQMAMAAILVLLPVLGPTGNLSPGADRILGILLGNVVFAAFNLGLWPIYAGSPTGMSRIVRGLARLERLISRGDSVGAQGQIFDIHRGLARALARQDEARFEPFGRSPAAAVDRGTLFLLTRHLQDSFQALLSAARARMSLDFSALDIAVAGAVLALEEAIALRLERHADCLDRGRLDSSPPLAPLLERLRSLSAGPVAAELEEFVVLAQRLVHELRTLEEVLVRYSTWLARLAPAGRAAQPAPR